MAVFCWHAKKHGRKKLIFWKTQSLRFESMTLIECSVTAWSPFKKAQHIRKDFSLRCACVRASLSLRVLFRLRAKNGVLSFETKKKRPNWEKRFLWMLCPCFRSDVRHSCRVLMMKNPKFLLSIEISHHCFNSFLAIEISRSKENEKSDHFFFPSSWNHTNEKRVITKCFLCFPKKSAFSFPPSLTLRLFQFEKT